MRITIGGAVIEYEKILLVKKKSTWILPGGKPEEGESDLVCLSREFREELSGTQIDPRSAVYFDTFKGISPNKNLPIEIRVYRVDLASKLGNASAEILDRKWLNYEEAIKLENSELTCDILNSLRYNNFL